MLSLNSNNTPILSTAIENGISKVYQLMFENVGKNGFVGHLDAGSQSEGTLRSLMLLPALYLASKRGKIVVVDDINISLSHSMVKGLIGYFANMEDTNGQLIFTTHDIQLLDEKSILRSDEVWFVDKKDGASIMYSHNDFKEHHSISMYNGYNEGRFGAIRFINLS
jgi:AAA15 family ATPase/GTPase